MGNREPRIKSAVIDASDDGADNDESNNDEADGEGADSDVAGNDVTHRDVSSCVKAKENSLTLLYTNAQSLINKVNKLKIIISISNPNIIVITETWTNDSISDDFLGISGYELIERKDQNNTLMGRGGGICVYVRKCMYAWKEECETLFNQCGMIGLKRDSCDLHIMAVYRSLNSTKTNDDNLCAYV